MANLEACYFCGTVEDVTRDTVAPKAETAGSASPPTVALCPDCRTRLEAILSSLEVPTEDAPAPSSQDEPTSIPVESDATQSPTTKSPEEPPEESTTTDTEDTDEPVVGDADPTDQGVTIDAESTEPEASSSAESDDAESASDTDSKRPTGYGKVLRFLRNRELPMARNTVVELAANAYELRRDQVETALDHAIETGALIEVDGELQRG